jgi:hypothetical protein
MRTFLTLLVIGGLGILYLCQKRSDTADSSAKPDPATVQVATNPTPAGATAASPTGQTSAHNWMKRSIDRARAVTQEARARTQQSQDP